jgi:uncharacterized membrane protein
MPTGSVAPATEKMDSVVGNLLRIGVSISGTVVFAGGLIYLFRHGGEMPAYHVFRGEPADLRSFAASCRMLVHCAVGIIQLGLLLLVATPVARVAYLVYAFSRQGDRLYSVIALIVLLLLICGLVTGRT